MKSSLLLIALFTLSLGHLLGKIRNGYEGQLQRTKESLEKLKAQLSEDINLSYLEKRKLKSKIKSLIDYISYYELTEELLAQLRIVSPDLYKEMDWIRDKRDRVTDIFVKLIPKEEVAINLEATSSFTHTTEDEDAHFSEYGKYSAAVNVSISEHSLLFLYHELGHISYVIPNFAIYSKFYKNYYRTQMIHASYIGHHVRDKSGKSAMAFERKFKEDRVNFVRRTSTKIEGAMSLIQKIRKNNRGLEAPGQQEPVYTRRVDRR